MIQVQKEVPESLHHTCVIATWPNMANGDEGSVIELANFADRSVQVTRYVGAADSQSAIVASAAAIGQTHRIVAAPVAVDAVASASSVVQTHLVAATDSTSQTTASAVLIAQGFALQYFTEAEMQEICTWLQANCQMAGGNAVLMRRR